MAGLTPQASQLLERFNWPGNVRQLENTIFRAVVLCDGTILDEVSKEYDGRLQIAKMNVDENRDVPAKFGIRGIPTLMLFKNGELAATKVGALSKSQLTAFLDGHL